MPDTPEISDLGHAAAARRLPAVIQGGMGVAVSNWRLAKAVSQAGCLGVVSGTALDRVVAYRLQEGDPGGHLRRIIPRFPVPGVAERVLARWFVSGGVARSGVYRSMPMFDHRPNQDSLELLVVSNFAEVALAKEGHDGRVGINLLEKIQAPNIASLYGAMLAGVDAVLMGAGIPRDIPAILDRLALHEEASMLLRVEGSLAGESTRIVFTPGHIVPPQHQRPLRRPPFLAVITSDILAQSLLRSTDGKVDGFVVEGPTAGGHNAPPRGNAGGLNGSGEPIYGPRDVADLVRLRALGRPFWLAGGYGVRGGLAKAQALGAHGVQIGTVFVLSEESGLTPALKAQMAAAVRAGELRVFTDPLASPTGFPFKVVELPGTISDPQVYAARSRVCNLGYLRQAYRLADGGLGWRCAAEPVAQFVAKGGEAAACIGRKCICNALLASAGFALIASDGTREAPIVTAGDGLVGLAGTIPGLESYGAAEQCRLG